MNILRSIKKGIKKLSPPKDIKGLKMLLPQTPAGMGASVLLG